MIDQSATLQTTLLLYRRTCRKCQLLSIIAVALSLGSVRRIPNDSPDALALLGDDPRIPVKVTAIRRGRVYTGGEILLVMMIALFDHLLYQIRHVLARKGR